MCSLSSPCTSTPLVLRPCPPPPSASSSNPTSSRSQNTQLHVAHINICSIRNKIRDVHSLISTNNYDILGVSETWLTTSYSDSLLHIPGYRTFRKDRTSSRGGGVCFYVRDTLSASTIAHSHDLECLLLRVTFPGHQHAIFACVYRPPTSGTSFWPSLTNCLDDAHGCTSALHDIFLLGDFNINVLSPTPVPQHHLYLQFLADAQLQNVVHVPTRVLSNACLDLILTPITTSLPGLSIGNISVLSLDGVSDHHVISLFVSFPFGVRQRSSVVPRKVRCPALHQVDVQQMSTDIQTSLADPATDHMTLDDATLFWQHSIMSVLDAYCPEKLLPPPAATKPRRPMWETPELRRLFLLKRSAHRALLTKNPNDVALREKFRALRRQFQLLNKKTRSQYYQELFTSVRRQPRLHWKLLNGLLGRHHVATVHPVSTCDFTATFSRVVRAPAPSPDPLAALEGPCLSSGFTSFATVSPHEVLSLLNNLNPFKSTGPDGISPRVLKAFSATLADSVTQLVNESLSTSVVPLSCKRATVTPIYKKGDPLSAGNYRPISLLNSLSKVLERVAHSQLRSYIENKPADYHPILPPQQFAYRSGHSCEDLLSRCINDWHRALDTGQVVGVVLLDMSKAFDCVDHELLLLELQSCGVSGSALSWLCSYLHGRVSRVGSSTILPGEDFSSTRGVPQGSVLGPLLFTLYIRSLPSVLHHCSSSLYADDVQLYVSNADPHKVVTMLERDVADVRVFLEGRGLNLNECKTEFLLLHRPSFHLPLPSLRIGNTVIPPSVTARYLGLVIDHHLSFAAHISALRGKVAAKLQAFQRVRHQFTTHACRTFYLCFIQSTLEYGSNSFVHSLHKCDYDQLIRLSKRAQRVVFGFPSRAHTDPIRRRNLLCSIESRYNFKLFVLVFRCLHGFASPLLQDMFHLQCDATHTSRATRSQATFGISLPSARTRFGLFSLSFLAADRWNSLPCSLRCISSHTLFCQQLRLLLGFPVIRPSPVGNP